MKNNKFRQELIKISFDVHNWIVRHMTIKSVTQKHHRLMRKVRLERRNNRIRMVKAKIALNREKRLDKQFNHDSKVANPVIIFYPDGSYKKLNN